MRIKKEIDKRQLIESGGHPVNPEICSVFISHSLHIPDPKRRGEARDSFTMIQGTNKVITFLVPKRPSSHTLGQNILLVRPWVKPPVITLKEEEQV